MLCETLSLKIYKQKHVVNCSVMWDSLFENLIKKHIVNCSVMWDSNSMKLKTKSMLWTAMSCETLSLYEMINKSMLWTSMSRETLSLKSDKQKHVVNCSVVWDSLSLWNYRLSLRKLINKSKMHVVKKHIKTFFRSMLNTRTSLVIFFVQN